MIGSFFHLEGIEQGKVLVREAENWANELDMTSAVKAPENPH